MTRLAILYVHLIACCIAIGLVLSSDIAAVKRLLLGANEPDDIGHLNYLKTAVSFSLAALWLTGIAMIGLDASVKGLEYYDNPKIQAKIAIVLLLTLNGFVLHHSVLPTIEKFGSLLKLPFNPRMLAMFAGAVSGVSWLYAAMLGVGRPLAWKYSLFELLVAYPFLIAGSFAMVLTLAFWARNKARIGMRLASWKGISPNHSIATAAG